MKINSNNKTQSHKLSKKIFLNNKMQLNLISNKEVKFL
jgi:hypothetical protein